MFRVLISSVVPFLGWYIIFQGTFLDFWQRFAIITFVLALYALVMGGDKKFRFNKYELAVSVFVIFLSYFLFWILKFIVKFIPVLNEDVKAVYELAKGYDLPYIMVFLILIASFEEIFWRGYLTKLYLEKVNNPLMAIIYSSLLYGLVHIFSGNIALVLSGIIFGGIMSLLYFVFGKVVVNIIVHAAWSVLIFLLLPLM
ncbi:MAG: protease family protein [Thermotogaceae bacterium]|jgi:hypothetical protein|nr:protease family protein [Thermotogaceae bacterium]